MNVLVIAPHPDDDAVGMGGSIKRHAEAGDVVHVLYLTSGEGAAPSAVREDEAHDAAQSQGNVSSTFWRKKDGGVVAGPVEIQDLFVLCVEREIYRVYSPHISDTHPDHKAAYLIARQVMQRRRTEWWCYEVWTPLAQFDHLVEISAQATYKRAAIRAHKSQLANDFETAALALNMYRGVLHGPHKLYAEVFKEGELV